MSEKMTIRWLQEQLQQERNARTELERRLDRVANVLWEDLGLDQLVREAIQAAKDGR